MQETLHGAAFLKLLFLFSKKNWKYEKNRISITAAEVEYLPAVAISVYICCLIFCTEVSMVTPHAQPSSPWRRCIIHASFPIPPCWLILAGSAELPELSPSAHSQPSLHYLKGYVELKNSNGATYQKNPVLRQVPHMTHCKWTLHVDMYPLCRSIASMAQRKGWPSY